MPKFDFVVPGSGPLTPADLIRLEECLEKAVDCDDFDTQVNRHGRDYHLSLILPKKDLEGRTFKGDVGEVYAHPGDVNRIARVSYEQREELDRLEDKLKKVYDLMGATSSP